MENGGDRECGKRRQKMKDKKGKADKGRKEREDRKKKAGR